MKNIVITIFALILGITALSAAPEDEIGELLKYVSNLEGATFSRNGTTHTAKEAAEHMRMKWQRQKKKIHSAEDFIDLCGSKSYLSGKRYTIKLKDGAEKFSDEVLKAELNRIRSAAKK
ncbi:MAG: DUF5329 domain-containing protein [Verrucomicrobia bacterium]|nr:DUF5329 domain-containing protein [Verrucomicrobiota bacterium]